MDESDDEGDYDWRTPDWWELYVYGYTNEIAIKKGLTSRTKMLPWICSEWRFGILIV